MPVRSRYHPFLKKFIFILYFFANWSLAQTNEFKFDSTCFLIGLLNDYNGRIESNHPDFKDKVAYFFCSERNFALLLQDSLKRHSIQHEYKDEGRAGIVVRSRQFSNMIQNFYKKERYEPLVFETDVDIEYPSYILRLEFSKFDTRDKCLSFLMGTFLKYGVLKNDKMILTYANSMSHYETAYRVAKRLKMKKIRKIISNNTVPAKQQLEFILPQNYLAIFEHLKKIKPLNISCN